MARGGRDAQAVSDGVGELLGCSEAGDAAWGHPSVSAGWGEGVAPRHMAALPVSPV